MASAEIDAAYISGSVAALAIVGSFLTTWISLRHQRNLVQEERLATLRANAYVRLLEHQRVDPDFANLLPADVGPLIIAYGSEEVNALLGRVRDPANRGRPDAFGEQMDALVAQIRLELQKKRDNRRLNVTTRWRQQ